MQYFGYYLHCTVKCRFIITTYSHFAICLRYGNLAGEITPSFCNLSSSSSTRSLKVKATSRALQSLGLAPSCMVSFHFMPLSFPIPASETLLYLSRMCFTFVLFSSHSLMDLISHQSSLKCCSQFLSHEGWSFVVYN